jgi:hypothetical protein
VITDSPADAQHAYKVRCNDGAAAMLRRNEFSILKEFKGIETTARGIDFEDWQPFIIYRCVVGSQAFGLSGDDSDVDRRGIYLPPAELHWSLYGVPEHLRMPAHPARGTCDALGRRISGPPQGVSTPSHCQKAVVNVSTDSRLHRIVAAQPYPLLFATISGAHVLPLDVIVGPQVRTRRSRLALTELKQINSPKTTSASWKR